MAKIGLNEQVADHARAATDWRFQDKADKAYALMETINTKLFGDQLPSPVIGFDGSGRLKKAGDYYYEGDDISLRFHFNLRKDLTELETVIALLHNSVHCNHEVYNNKTSWYHKLSFRKAMKIFGLTCTAHGDLKSIDVAVFGEVLNTILQGHLVAELATFEVIEIHGAEVKVDAPVPLEVAAPVQEKQPKQGKKGYVKFTCSCGDNIRGAPHVEATCRKCFSKVIDIWLFDNPEISTLQTMFIVAVRDSMLAAQFAPQN